MTGWRKKSKCKEAICFLLTRFHLFAFSACKDDAGFCATKNEDDCYLESEITTMQQKCPVKCGYCAEGSLIILWTMFNVHILPNWQLGYLIHKGIRGTHPVPFNHLSEKEFIRARFIENGLIPFRNVDPSSVEIVSRHHGAFRKFADPFLVNQRDVVFVAHYTIFYPAKIGAEFIN